MRNNLISNRYLITRHIGKGGMADVYLATDTILKREVAIKILKDDLSNDKVALERFRREANASTCLSHTNIVDVYDVGDDKDDHYIVMEYIKGQTLKQLIKKRGPIYYPEAVSIMKQLCAAIMEAHRNGIIHRDIKSQNVLIKDDGTAKVVDFGIALASNANQITGEDSILGSVHYMAPEHVKGETATMQSDIYSLGIVFFELLTADLPFKGDNAVQVVMNSTKNPLPDVKLYDKRIPQSVVNIVKKATAKNRHNRYDNVAAMLKDLNECLSDKHSDDKPLVFAYSEDIAKNKDNGKKEQRHSKRPAISKKKKKMIIGLSCGGIVLTAVIFSLIYFLMSMPRYVNVPDITNQTVIEASETLKDYNLLLDLSDITREMTDDVESGKIIRVIPDIGTQVEENTTIKVVVSDGKYAVMTDYTGQNVSDAKEKILSDFPSLSVDIIAVDSSEPSGIVVKQEGLAAGDKFDPKRSEKVTLYYSRYTTVIIPYGIIGNSIDGAKAILDDMNLEYELVLFDPNGDQQLASNQLVADTIVAVNPKEGSSYTPNSSSKITLIYIDQNTIDLIRKDHSDE